MQLRNLLLIYWMSAIRFEETNIQRKVERNSSNTENNPTQEGIKIGEKTPQLRLNPSE